MSSSPQSAIIVVVQVRLAGGLVPPADREVWLPGPAGRAAVAGDGAAPGLPAVAGDGAAPAIPAVAGDGAAPGTPVVVGPRTATDDEIAGAIEALQRLVGAGGTLAAGADVDLGSGFRSARIDGGPGDRRDALLAALGTGATDLGPPAAILVALFGPSATKRVGAAARRAIADGAWPVLRFAAAASDVLGPEQLEQVLALTAPERADPFGEGLASDVAAHLGRLLAPVPQARRLAVLVSLWEQAAVRSAAAARRERVKGSQDRFCDVDKIARRYRRFDDDGLIAMMRQHLGPDPSLADAARWSVPQTYWQVKAERLGQDAIAATVLGRLAETAVEHGELVALQRHRAELAAVAGFLTRAEVKRAHGEKRPAVVVWNLVHRLPGAARTPAFVAQRLGRARDWGDVLHREIDRFMWYTAGGPAARSAVDEWLTRPMTAWRAAAGLLSPDRLAGWARTPWGAVPVRLPFPGEPDPEPVDVVPDGNVPLPERLRDDPDAERIGDFFWYAELGDVLARLHGLERAIVDERMTMCPEIMVDVAPPPEPLAPSLESVTAAVAGAAQLAELGGTVPPRPASWPALTDALYRGAAVAEALTGRFAVPPAFDRVDGVILPGTGLRVEVARTGRQLAEWAGYMGNCIGGEDYTEAAEGGRCVLLALRGPDERIALNVELRHRSNRWMVDELKARYNKDPQPEHRNAIQRWAHTLPVPPPPLGVIARVPHGRTGNRTHTAARLRRETGPALIELIAEPPLDALIELAHLLPAAPTTSGPEAVTALRRAAPATVTEACRRFLVAGGLRRLWEQTGHRPMARAVAELGDDRLVPLAADEPLPRNLRPLAHLSEITAARTADVVALRVRAALGWLLRDDNPDLVRAVTARPAAPVLCAMSLAVTWWGLPGAVLVEPGEDQVPGFPSTVLSAGPWQAARRDAADLGATPGVGGLVVPYSWLGAGGWPALWSRASR